MGNDRDRRRHGDGISSYHSKRRNGRVYMVSYYWRGDRQTETVPEPYDGDGRRKRPLTGLAAARALKADRERDRFRSDWLPPKVAKAAAKKRADRIADERDPLLFEAAVERFLRDAERTGRYVDGGKTARATFRTLGRMFSGRHLDEIRMPEIREYFISRVACSGPFADWKYPVRSVRPAEVDVKYLSTLYRWLQRAEGRHLVNPCHRPTGGGKGSILAPYRRKHEPVVPTPPKLREILSARRRGGNGREMISDAHRAFFALCYFTAARPESEPCRLRHGDVRFRPDGWADVTYRDTKNADSRRTLPIPPEAAGPLRAIMTGEPSRFEKARHAAWRERFVFRRTGKATAWDHWSYLKAWRHVRRVVDGIDGMWVRDLRPTAKTRLAKAGIREAVTKRFLGHVVNVAEAYDIVDADDLRSAAEALRLDGAKKVVADLVAGQEGS